MVSPPLPRNECPGYDTKQNDGEVPVMVEFYGMRATPSWPSLPGQLWPRVLAPDRILSMSQIELNFVLKLNWIVWNGNVFVCWNELLGMELFWHLTLCKQKLYLYQTELFELELFD